MDAAGPRCFAHRGFAEAFPENTITAVERAVAAGADAIEVDLRRCESGEVVVVHDETVDRVTDGSGAVADHSLAELQALDVLGTGEGIPRFSDVLATVPEDVLVNAELKECGLAADVLAVAADRDADVLVSSFDVAALRETGETGSAPLALLFAEHADDALATARELGCRAVHPHWKLCDEAFVTRARNAGFAVNAWTVGSASTARRLVEAGVDGLIADAPAYCLNVEGGSPDDDG